jgi:hypothetical protein
MNNRIARYFPILTTALVFLVITLAFTAHAAEGGIVSPLKPEVSSIPGFIEAALKALVLIALPILTLFIVYSGFLFIAARGNSSKLEEAKRNFMYVIIGALLILGAWVVATLVGGTINQLTG